MDVVLGVMVIRTPSTFVIDLDFVLGVMVIRTPSTFVCDVCSILV